MHSKKNMCYNSIINLFIKCSGEFIMKNQKTLYIIIDNTKRKSFSINYNKAIMKVHSNILIEDILKSKPMLRTLYHTVEKVKIVQSGAKEICQFIKNNPLLENKMIIIDKGDNYSYEEALELKSSLNSKSKYLIKLYDNDLLITIDEYIQTTFILKQYLDEILQYDLSPIEQIMYAYDISRDRLYQEEDRDDDFYLSHDLTWVLTKNKCVCGGFCRVFNALVKMLGYYADSDYGVMYDNACESDVIHAISIVNVNDDKYNIHGIYIFDPTFDCKKSEDDILYYYLYFAKTFAFFTFINNDYQSIRLKYSIDDLISYLINHNYYEKEIIEEVMFLADRLQAIELTYLGPGSKKKLVQELSLKKDIFNRPINSLSLINAIINVKKCERESNRFNYLLNEDMIRYMLLSSYWYMDGKDHDEIKTKLSNEDTVIEEEIKLINEKLEAIDLTNELKRSLRLNK